MMIWPRLDLTANRPPTPWPMENFCSGCQKQFGHVCQHLQSNKLSMTDGYGYGSHKVGKTASFFCTTHNRSLYDAFGTTLPEKIGLFRSSS